MDVRELLANYGVRSWRVHRHDGVESGTGPGGGLAEAVEARGAASLSAIFGDPRVDALELSDADLSLRLERSGRLEVRWAGGEAHEERITMPAPPASAPTALGPAWFRERHGLRHAYLAGAMAGGIASTDLVIAMAKAGYLAFFGAGGLPLSEVEAAVGRVKAALKGEPAGFNLLHNPVEPAVEEATVDLYLREGIRYVDAAAFMGLTPAVVRYRCTGLRQEGGRLVAPNRLFAKVSRPEVAEQFLRPAPHALLDALVKAGKLKPEEAALAGDLPMADAITCEGDSGGHTDRRPTLVLVPLMRRLRDRISREQGYAERGQRVAIGAAGGIGTPEAIAAAFTLGADYVMTGSVNQATLEAGTSPAVKKMLLEAGMADVAMGPAPDMFELGAEVQVLGRGTMYAQRGRQLHEAWKGHSSWEEIPAKTREKLEKQVLGRPFDEVWKDTAAFWASRDPKQVERANTDGRHKMALVFRWYLGMSSRWARMGEDSRKKDFQIWCGPAMGAFNDWARSGPLEELEARSVVAVAEALIAGALQEQVEAWRRAVDGR